MLLGRAWLHRDTDGDISSGSRWKNVEVALRIVEPGLVHVSHIETRPRYRRCELATAVLRELCEWADGNDIRLRLHPHRASVYGGSALNTEELEVWYQRFGFDFEDECMVRFPVPVGLTEKGMITE